MKILFITNFYPPYKIGGYELLCQQVLEELVKRGHSVRVLTSVYGINEAATEQNIHRCLVLESNLDHYRVTKSINYPLAKDKNIAFLRQEISSFQPDIIFIWGMWSLSKQIAAEAEVLLNGRVVYYLANPWPIEKNLHVAYWDLPTKRAYLRPVKKIVRFPFRFWLRSEWQAVSLRFQNAPCCSEALRNQLITSGVPLKEAPIIYEGIDLQKYAKFGDLRINTRKDGHLSLLYVGILAPHKGVHTAVEAISHLNQINQQKVDLTIVGTGLSEYEIQLHHLVETFQLQNIVKFHNPIPRSELPEFLGRFDVLILPSTWEEPLALIMQEALASGMTVIGTATGGTKEIIKDGQNGFLFSPSDSSELAHIIERLMADPSIVQRIGMEGRKTAFSMFDFNRMVDELENLLDKVNCNV